MRGRTGFRRRSSLALIASAAAAVVRPAPASAATFTWNVATSQGFGYFNVSGNWVGNAAPGPSASAGLVFPVYYRASFNPTADHTDALNSLTFNNVTSSTATAVSYAIAGNQLNIGAGGITDYAPQSASIGNPVLLTASQTWTLGQSLAAPAGPLTLSSSQNLNNQTLTIQANGSSTLTANLTGTGPVYVQGSGVLTLNGSSTITGDLHPQGGGLIIPAGATMNCGTTFVTTSGFNLSGGTLTGNFSVGGSGAMTAMIASGTYSGNEIDVGFSSQATLTQTGGTQSSYFLDVGGYAGGTAQAGTGTFNLSGGLVNTNELDVGFDDTDGVLHQTGGTINASSAFIGGPHNGTMTVSGASSAFNVSGALTIGTTGSTSTASLTISNNAYSLITGQVSLNSSSAVLNISSPQFFQAGSLSGVAGSSVLLTNPNGNSALNMQPATAMTGVFRGNVSGTGGLFLNSSFINQQLLGSDTFTGPVTVQGGTLEMATGTSTTTAVIASGTVNYQDCEIGLYGQGLLVQTGGVRTGGQLYIGAGNSPSVFGTFNFSGGTVNQGGGGGVVVGYEGPGVLNQTGGTINSGSVTIGNFESGCNGQASISGSAASWNLAGGGIQIGISNDPTTGQLTASNGASIVTTGALNLKSSAASVNISSATVTATRLTGAAGASLTLADPAGGTALTLNSSTTNTYTYAGNINGTGGLLYNGSVTQVLSGTNTFTGKATVTSGTLEMANGKSPLYQVSGGSLIFDSGGSFSAAGGAVANVGSGVLTNNATFTGAINLYNGGALRGNGSASQINMTQVNTGFFPGGAGTLPAFNGSGYCIIEVVPLGATVVVNSPTYANTQTTITVEPLDNLTLAGGLNGNLVEIFGGGTLHLASSSINILNFYSGTVQLTSPTSVLTAGSVNFVTSPGSLDVNKGAAIITGTSLSALTADVKAGYNLTGGGQWNGSNSIISSAAAADPSHLTAVGVIGNNQSGSPLYTAARPFHGVTPGATATLIAYTWFGDANLDGKVDGSDYSLIDAGYNSHGSLTGWYHGDFNYDGVVDGSDYALIDNDFNNQSLPINPSALVAAATAEPTAVPEPAGLGLTGLAAMVMRRRRSTGLLIESH